MYSDVSAQFRQKILSGAVQQIRGTLTLIDGSEPIVLDDTNLIGSPEIEMQCTEDADSFGFGELYTGSLSLTLNLPSLMREQLRGGEITLENGVDDEFVPLGRWTITDPQRDSAGRLKVTALDCVSKLDVPIKMEGVGGAYIDLRLEVVSRLSGVEFSQTQDDLYSIFGRQANFYGVGYAATCRQEVANIARLLGGFACADRSGRIEFRKYGSTPACEIPEALRFSADMNEYTCAITAVTYSDKYGRDTTVSFPKTPPANTELDLHFSGNNFIYGNTDCTYILEEIADQLSPVPVWTPGEVRYYGDPTLDLGDLVTLTFTGKPSVPFLVTGIRWRFRAPQTLTSAGAGVSSGSSSGGYTSSQSAATVTMNVTKTNRLIDMDVFDTPPSSGIQEAAECYFGVRDTAAVIATVNAVAAGGEVHILLDGIMQTVLDSSDYQGRRTVSLCVPLTVQPGLHRISVEVMNCTLLRLAGSVFGQEITTDTGDTTFDDQYSFNSGTILKYRGISVRPAIPDKIRGERVDTLGYGSFESSDVEFVIIPEGTEEIQ